MFRAWFESKRKAKGCSSAKHRRHNRLSFEHLETKSLLATLVVDINNPTADQPGDNLYAQIQEAVDAAAEGDLIKVHSGTYEPFRVRVPNVTIREARWNSNPVIDNPPHGNPEFGDEVGIFVFGNNVTIKGLIVDNGPQTNGDTFSGNVGFSIGGSGHRIINNVTQGGGSGFFVSGLGGHKLINNSATDAGTLGFEIRSSDNLFLRNNATNINYTGFRLGLQSDNNTFKYNKAEATLIGFWAVDGEENTFYRNVATDNHQGFLFFRNAGNNVLIGNIAKGNQMGGFRIQSGDNVVRGNWAIDSGVNGFRVNTEQNTVGRNWVYTEEEGLMPFGSNENHSRSRGIWSRLVDAVMDNDGERDSLFTRRSRRFNWG